jgi:hypothetical protein
MLITWDTYQWREDADGEEEEVLVPDSQGTVVPDCCETVQRFMTVRLGYNPAAGFDVLVGPENPPVWQVSEASYELVRVRYGRAAFDLVPPIPAFCPHCGTALPAIELRPVADLPGPVNPGSEGYCGTCHERNRACKCFVPWVRWQTVKEVSDGG